MRVFRTSLGFAAAVLVLWALPALAGSTVNPNVPAPNSALTSAPIRGNFAAAANDVNNILGMFAGSSAPGAPIVGQDWLDTSGIPATWKKRYNTGWGTIGTFNLSTGAFIYGGSITCGALPALTGDVTKPAGSCVTTLATAQSAVHTWGAVQTFTVAPVFTDQSGSRTALGLGTAAVQNTGTSGATVPLLNGVNTWGAVQTLPSPALSGTVTGNNTIPLGILQQSAANTTLGNWSGSTANVSANAMPSCPDTSGSHLNYVSGTGITCGTSTGAAAAGSLTGTTLSAGVTGSSLTSVGTLGGGSASTGFTIAASNVTWSGTVPIANLPVGTSAAKGILQGDGSTTTITAGVIACTTATSAQIGCARPDNSTITITGGVLTAIGGAATDVTVGTTTVTGGTSAYLLYNNAGVLGNRTIASVLTAGNGILVTGTTNAGIAVDVASGANFLAGTENKILDASVVFQAETTTTYGSTTTFNMSTFINTKVTLTGNISTVTFSNIKAGQAGKIRFIQDATGSRTLPGTFNANFVWASGTQPVLTTTASAVDELVYDCSATNYCLGSLIKNVKATP